MGFEMLDEELEEIYGIIHKKKGQISYVLKSKERGAPVRGAEKLVVREKLLEAFLERLGTRLGRTADEK